MTPEQNAIETYHAQQLNLKNMSHRLRNDHMAIHFPNAVHIEGNKYSFGEFTLRFYREDALIDDLWTTDVEIEGYENVFIRNEGDIGNFILNKKAKIDHWRSLSLFGKFKHVLGIK